MELKSKPTSEETPSSGKLSISIQTYDAAQVKLPKELVESLIDLLNLGSLFADHCRLVISVNGPHSVRIRKSILDDIECDPSDPFDQLIYRTFTETDSQYLDILLTHLPDGMAPAIGSTITNYFMDQRGFTDPTPKSIADLIKKLQNI